MNVYFLVEGKTERKVYPKWLDYLAPKLRRVTSPELATNDSYYLISGGGYPSLLDNHLTASIEDVNDSPQYDFLVLVLDTDDQTAQEKTIEVETYAKRHKLTLKTAQLVIIPQVICMETWFLGNRKIYPRNSSDPQTAAFSRFYDVSKNDPELMDKPKGNNTTKAIYHSDYLKAILREKHIRYSKNMPNGVHEPHYIEALRTRIESDPNSLKSMNTLFEFLHSLSNQIQA